MLKPIINSTIDTDLYKLSMQWAVMQCFPEIRVRYTLIVRSKNKFPDGFDSALYAQIKHLSTLSLEPFEEKYLQTIKFLPQLYIDFLKGYRYNPEEISISLINGDLHITIEGLWYRTILWEVPLLAIISELYYIITGENKKANISVLIPNAKADILLANNIKFSDFGTRRRFSEYNHDLIVSIFAKQKYKSVFVGSSNVHYARKHNVKSMGTVAHEWFMVHGALYGYKLANQLALENWVNVYKGDLGIALSDTYTSDVFFSQFDKKYAKLFDGVRQDSGDPFIFADKAINHYKSLGINPMSKSIIFSDSLDVHKAKALNDYCKDKIMCSFGIGTNFTNDVGVTPLSIVIKVSEVFYNGRWVSTVKLSDDEGKHTGDKKEIEVCKYILGL